MPKCAHYRFVKGGIAVWRIEESSDVLYGLLATHKYDAQLAEKKHEGRRAEWLAVRLLVAEVLGADKEVAYHPSGCPCLTDGSFYISIYHTKDYAALAYHAEKKIGVDVEYVSSRVERIAHRFTSTEETAYIEPMNENDRMMCYLINWSAKETLYKLVDDHVAADFRAAFFIHPYRWSGEGVLHAEVLIPQARRVNLHYMLHPDYVCTWAVDEE